MKKLSRSFYLRPTLQVAKDLLGKYFCRQIQNKILIGKIVEVEAYLSNDPASHSYRGKTKRNDVMFWNGGYLYVYFTYGMHFCANVVTGREGLGEAVLIRAVEPILGIEVMWKNRFPNLKSLNHQSLINLTNGPAKFCQAFGIGRNENGVDLLDDMIFISDLIEPNKAEHTNYQLQITAPKIERSSRIGIKNGLEKKWRFYIKGNLWVSRK